MSEFEPTQWIPDVPKPGITKQQEDDAKRVLSKVKLGMTRNEVFELLGPHDGHNIGSRKYPKPTIYLYGAIELYFHYANDGGLYWVYTENKDHDEAYTLLGSGRG